MSRELQSRYCIESHSSPTNIRPPWGCIIVYTNRDFSMVPATTRLTPTIPNILSTFAVLLLSEADGCAFVSLCSVPVCSILVLSLRLQQLEHECRWTHPAAFRMDQANDPCFLVDYFFDRCLGLV